MAVAQAYFPGAALGDTWPMATTYQDLTNGTATAMALHQAQHSTLLPIHATAGQVPVPVSYFQYYIELL